MQSCNFRGQTNLDAIFSFAINSCVTSGLLLNLSEVHSPPAQKCLLTGDKAGKAFSTVCLAQSNYSTNVN